MPRSPTRRLVICARKSRLVARFPAARWSSTRPDVEATSRAASPLSRGWGAGCPRSGGSPPIRLSERSAMLGLRLAARRLRRLDAQPVADVRGLDLLDQPRDGGLALLGDVLVAVDDERRRGRVWKLPVAGPFDTAAVLDAERERRESQRQRQL